MAMSATRQCPVCGGWRTWAESEVVCDSCRLRGAQTALKDRDAYEREWRRVAHYLAFDQWLFDHGRLND